MGFRNLLEDPNLSQYIENGLRFTTSESLLLANSVKVKITRLYMFILTVCKDVNMIF